MPKMADRNLNVFYGVLSEFSVLKRGQMFERRTSRAKEAWKSGKGSKERAVANQNAAARVVGAHSFKRIAPTLASAPGSAPYPALECPRFASVDSLWKVLLPIQKKS